jgi:hypothetical protein
MPHLNGLKCGKLSLPNIVGSALQMRQARQDINWAIIESISGQILQVLVGLSANRQ